MTEEEEQEIVESERAFNTQMREQIEKRNKGWAKKLWPQQVDNRRDDETEDE